LLTGFFWVIEFVVALNFATQLHWSPAGPHWIGPLHWPDISKCLQSGSLEHLHIPPGQSRSAKADVTTQENNMKIATMNIGTRRMMKHSLEAASA
jgi:hypothetical protein